MSNSFVTYPFVVNMFSGIHGDSKKSTLVHEFDNPVVLHPQLDWFVKLIHYEIPRTVYNFDTELGNNRFTYDLSANPF